LACRAFWNWFLAGVGTRRRLLEQLALVGGRHHAGHGPFTGGQDSAVLGFVAGQAFGRAVAVDDAHRPRPRHGLAAPAAPLAPEQLDQLGLARPQPVEQP
jgi:hypothetical protein